MQSRKTGGTRFGSPGQSNSNNESMNQSTNPVKGKNFIKDMKKHGIFKAFNDINKFSEFFQNSSSINQETLNTEIMNTSSLNQDSSMQNIADATNSKNTKSTYILEEMQNEATDK